jgi:Uma2 family endonuclease
MMNSPILICDSQLADELLLQRRANGRDRYDEVWNGVYIMSPIANNEHQELASEIVAIIRTTIDWKGLGKTLAGANVSDRTDDWQQNYRVPDVLVFSNTTTAIDRTTHWYGGPEIAIEIVSAGDRSYEKLDFYATVGTGELLIIDRHPWKLTLYRKSVTGRLEPQVISTFETPNIISSQYFPLQFRLQLDPASIILSSDNQVIRSIPIIVP